MKIKNLFVSFLFVLYIVAMMFFISGHLQALSSEYRRPVQYNPQKINRFGEYQPFYGYTIVAMIDPSLTTAAERIERFLRNSSISTSYAALPASTYHMTIFSIYQCGNRMIPPVQRWVNATDCVTISPRFWLPTEVLREQNDKAMCVIERYLNEPLRIKYASLNVSQRNINLLLEVDERSLTQIRTVRDEFKKIYEDLDLSMEPIDEKLHITFGYVYGPDKQMDVDEWNQLNKLVRTFNGESFSLPSVYLFDSMTNYIPYRKRRGVEC